MPGTSSNVLSGAARLLRIADQRNVVVTTSGVEDPLALDYSIKLKS